MLKKLVIDKKITNKIIILLLFVFMFNFIFAHLGNKVVFANNKEVIKEVKDAELKDGGGKLLLPIHSFVLWVADAILQLAQKTMYSPQPIIQKAKSEDMSNVNTGAIVLCIVAAAVCVAAIIYTCGVAATGLSATATAAAGATTGIGMASTVMITAAPFVGKAVRRYSSGNGSGVDSVCGRG